MIYLDTSVAVPLFVAEPSSDRIDRWYSDCEVPLIAAEWMATEFASALSIKERSGSLSTKDANAAWRGFEAFCQTGLRLIPVSSQAFKEAAHLARHAAHGLRAGDALHLAVAKEVAVSELATLDAALAVNAKRLKIKVVVFS